MDDGVAPRAVCPGQDRPGLPTNGVMGRAPSGTAYHNPACRVSFGPSHVTPLQQLFYRGSEVQTAAPHLSLLVQVATRTFSKTGFKPRGDVSSWTDTPEQAASKQAAGGSFLGGGGPAVLALGELGRCQC